MASKNPIEDVVKSLGFKGDTASFLTTVIFVLLVYVVVGVVAEGAML